jgi:aldehyde:ferredoxin oxidoreductase
VSEKAHKVTNAISSCNVLFCSRTKVTSVFKEDIQAISVLHSSCINEEDFAIKIGALAGLFEVKLEPLRGLLKKGKAEENWKSTKLVEMWLRGSEEFAMHGKGVAITSYEPRGSMIDAIDLAVSSVGALHGARGSPKVVFRDSATLCGFNQNAFEKVFGSMHRGVSEFVNAETEWSSTEEEMKTIMMRAYTLERCFSLREGEYVPTRDDDLPKRSFTETIYNKYGEPKVLDREEFLASRKMRYIKDGLNDQGLPTKENLQKLGLEFVIPVLHEMSLVE